MPPHVPPTPLLLRFCNASTHTSRSSKPLARLKPPRLLARNMSVTRKRCNLSIDNVNPNVKNAEYAVRGELAVRAEKYRVALTLERPPTPQATASPSLPFKSVVSANIGNPQQLDQKPITFFRQVASLVENPQLLDKEDALVEHLGYKPDAVDRARRLLHDVGSVGAYSHSQGVPLVRQSVASFIEQRDGFPSHPDSIFLSSGASGAVYALLNLICASSSTGVMVPIPQYPLYTASLSLLNSRCVKYYLDETTNWRTDLSSVRESLVTARQNGTDVRAIVIINPGNPTGGCLAPTDIKAIIDFAAEEDLLIIADEVYQTNIFEGDFYSFKRALRELQQQGGEAYDNVQLASLHSISKGMVGECGQRGGYMELVGFDQEVVAQLYKFVSISLCPPVVGQCLIECMVNPPRQGEPSYELYRKEYDAIFSGLRERAIALYEAFQEMEGVSCQKPKASMYLYPTVKVPPKACEQATKEGRKPDEFYVSRMLDATGVCMVPGEGFGQREGTMHFRTTFLPPGTEWVGRIKDFHKKFMDQFR